MRLINKPRRLFYAGIFVVMAVLASVLLFANQHPVRGQTDGGVLPWVINSVPARGEELPVDQGVMFTFNAPMNRASVESAFSVSPAAPGKFLWNCLLYTSPSPRD